MPPVNLDALDHNADWAKTTWDLPATNAAELQRWLFQHGMTWEQFTRLPVYRWNVGKLRWLREANRAEKALSTVHVRPYMRGGRLVHGYTREQEVGDRLDELRQKLGRVLGLPMHELAQSKREASSARTQEQVQQVQEKLRAMPDGAEIELEDVDARLLAFGPEATGQTSGLGGKYRKKGGKWWRVVRVGRQAPQGIMWEERLENPSRGSLDAILGARREVDDDEFAMRYRGMLLRPLGIGNFEFQVPTVEQITSYINEQTPVGDSIFVNAEGLQRWPGDNHVRKGVYYHGADGWHYYASTADMEAPEYGAPPSKPGTWLVSAPTEKMTQLFMHRFIDQMHDQHVRLATNDEQRAFEAEVQATVDPREFMRDDGSPGNAYRRQHALIMEAGELLDGEVERALREAEIPEKSEIFMAEDESRKAAERYSVLAKEQRRMAADIVEDVIAERLEQLGLPPPRSGPHESSIYFGNPEALHRDLTYRAPGKYTLETALQQATYAAQRDDPENEMVKLRQADPAAFRGRMTQFGEMVEDDANRRIAMEADRRNLIEPLAVASDERNATAERVRELHERLKKRGEVVRTVLAEHRAMGPGRGGPELQVANARVTKGIRTVIDAARWLPRDWIRASNKKPPQVRTQRAKRANYSTYGAELQTDGTPGTSLHELVHHVEVVTRELDAAQWAFWQRRARGGSFDGKMGKFEWVGGGAKRSERGVRDEFSHAYAGKAYAEGAAGSNWEVLTMGIPALFNLEYADLVWDDDDYRRFVLGMLMLG